MRANRLAAMALGLGLVAAAWGRDYHVFDVVGDSVSAGVNPDYYSPVPANYGWVHMLFGLGAKTPAPRHLAITNLWPGITRWNSAVSGSRAWEWADTNTYSYLPTVLSHGPDLVAVMIGANDFLSYCVDGVSQAEIDACRTNLTKIIRILQASAGRPEIVMVGYYDLFDGKSTNLTMLPQYKFLSEAAVRGNALMEGLARSNGCFYVDVYGDFMHHGYGESLGDTNHLDPDYVRLPGFDIHPVTPGHSQICANVYRQLTELKDIPKFAGVRCGSNGVRLTWTSGFGQTYVIRRATALTGAFEPVRTNVATPTVNVYTDSPPAADRVFYRLGAIE